MAKRYIGGYAILDLTSGTLYQDALALANVDKPILVYPENDKPVFADTFEIDTDNDLVIITIGGVTITIADDNTITTSGDIQPHLWEYRISNSNFDVGFVINLPFDIGTLNIDISDSDSFNEHKEILQKIYDCFKNVSVSLYTTYSDDDSIIGLKGKISIATSFFIETTCIATADMSETTDTFECSKTGDTLTSYISGEVYIERQRQLF